MNFNYQEVKIPLTAGGLLERGLAQLQHKAEGKDTMQPSRCVGSLPYCGLASACKAAAIGTPRSEGLLSAQADCLQLISHGLAIGITDATSTSCNMPTAKCQLACNPGVRSDYVGRQLACQRACFAMSGLRKSPLPCYARN